tara:strand:- start:84 stop:1202 length:1119 start_codon:yes stop_codon:yes gene_type:complete
MAEKQLDKRIGGFGNITSPGLLFGRGLPETAQMQNGPYEIGASQTDAFGRKYPTPTMTDSTAGIAPPYQGGSQSTMNNGHQDHTAGQHNLARINQNDMYDRGMNTVNQFEDLYQNTINQRDNSEYGPYAGGYQSEGRPSDALNYQQPQPYEDSLNSRLGSNNPGLIDFAQQANNMSEQPFQGADTNLAMPKDADIYLKNRVGEGSGASADQRNREVEDWYNERGQTQGKQSAQFTAGDTMGAAKQGGLNMADALGDGVRGTAKYGSSLLNAAVFGKDSKRSALGEGLGFLQKALFGTKPAQEAQGQVAPNDFQMTPEQQAMRDKGIADNPWLANEDSENWWETQDYEPTTPGGNVATRKFNRPTSYYGLGTN